MNKILLAAKGYNAELTRIMNTDFVGREKLKETYKESLEARIKTRMQPYYEKLIIAIYEFVCIETDYDKQDAAMVGMFKQMPNVRKDVIMGWQGRPHILMSDIKFDILIEQWIDFDMEAEYCKLIDFKSAHSDNYIEYKKRDIELLCNEYNRGIEKGKIVGRSIEIQNIMVDRYYKDAILNLMYLPNIDIIIDSDAACYPETFKFFSLLKKIKGDRNLNKEIKGILSDYLKLEDKNIQHTQNDNAQNSNDDNLYNEFPYLLLAEYIQGTTDAIEYMMKHKNPRDGNKLFWKNKIKGAALLFKDILGWSIPEINRCIQFKKNIPISESNRRKHESKYLRDILLKCK